MDLTIILKFADPILIEGWQLNDASYSDCDKVSKTVNANTLMN